MANTQVKKDKPTKKLTKIDVALRHAQNENFQFEFRDEKFTAKGDIPGIILLEFFAAADDEENVSQIAKATLTFLKNTIIEEDAKRFRKFLLESDPVIDSIELTEFAMKLIGEISGNQAEPSED